ncbi:hypothetical protein PAEPH01_1052 [Pancytospora epiphaga]|nr:hypothetical protein PAEPH01_1052 [Pancytospora epiphaga]
MLNLIVLRIALELVGIRADAIPGVIGGVGTQLSGVQVCQGAALTPLTTMATNTPCGMNPGAECMQTVIHSCADNSQAFTPNSPGNNNPMNNGQQNNSQGCDQSNGGNNQQPCMPVNNGVQSGNGSPQAYTANSQCVPSNGNSQQPCPPPFNGGGSPQQSPPGGMNSQQQCPPPNMNNQQACSQETAQPTFNTNSQNNFIPGAAQLCVGVPVAATQGIGIAVPIGQNMTGQPCTSNQTGQSDDQTTSGQPCKGQGYTYGGPHNIPGGYQTTECTTSQRQPSTTPLSYGLVPTPQACSACSKPIVAMNTLTLGSMEVPVADNFKYFKNSCDNNPSGVTSLLSGN